MSGAPSSWTGEGAIKSTHPVSGMLIVLNLNMVNQVPNSSKQVFYFQFVIGGLKLTHTLDFNPTEQRTRALTFRSQNFENYDDITTNFMAFDSC